MKYAILLSALLLLPACNGPEAARSPEKHLPVPAATAPKNESAGAVHTLDVAVQPLITFIELGSVNCIPCKKMQPIMKSIEKKYAEQVDVIFYDVWRRDQKMFAEIYDILSIPTQVFLDAEGNEITRHVGFFPEEEIDRFLVSQGLTPRIGTPQDG